MSKISGPILVTGAAGFVGSHLVERLAAGGHRVRVFVRYNSSASTGFLQGSTVEKHLEFHRGDIRDFDSVRTAVAGCGTVFHLAALVGIPYSYESPLAYLRTNGEGAYNILEACRKENVGNLLMTSTSEVYGEARHFPMNEDHLVTARSPYAASKIGADQLALSYHAAFGQPLKIVRPFNIFGPRQSARAIIPTVIAQIASGAQTLHLGNVEPTRDWTYVDDVVAAFDKIAQLAPHAGQIFHIGSGIEFSVANMVDRVARLIGRTVRIAADPDRVRPANSEVSRLLCDNTKLRTLTGWEPSADFDAGLAKTIDWVRAHPEMYPASSYAT